MVMGLQHEGRSGAPGDIESIGLVVRTIIAEQIGRPLSDIALGAKIESQLAIDSMAMIEINVSLEERFGFAMPDMALANEVETVRDLAAYIARRVAEERR